MAHGGFGTPVFLTPLAPTPGPAGYRAMGGQYGGSPQPAGGHAAMGQPGFFPQPRAMPYPGAGPQLRPPPPHAGAGSWAGAAAGPAPRPTPVGGTAADATAEPILHMIGPLGHAELVLRVFRDGLSNHWTDGVGQHWLRYSSHTGTQDALKRDGSEVVQGTFVRITQADVIPDFIRAELDAGQPARKINAAGGSGATAADDYGQRIPEGPVVVSAQRRPRMEKPSADTIKLPDCSQRSLSYIQRLRRVFLRPARPKGPQPYGVDPDTGYFSPYMLPSLPVEHARGQQGRLAGGPALQDRPWR
eukprot:TRINITY_DN9075_c0_g1_i1.p2 TRINITY_DN9075_c0_g1~~TRINITY_DN9075_c0_g1_i1.p2  ORF type:complete len:302 (+),score=50.34 TRINITY_DN9075_c0_g1_i1:78-983(+)